MAPTSAANTNQLVGQAQSQGNALQQGYNAQVPGLQNQYNQSYNQANQAYGNLLSYNQSLPQNYLNYTNQIAGQNGYNPQAMTNDMRNATTLSETMANLPQATSQMGNYSGATAGQVASNYARMAPNIATAQAGANTALGQQQAAYAAGQTGAQNITGQQTSNYQALYSQANTQMANAGNVMQQIQAQQQNQGYLTAEQVAAYQNAYSGYISAQASAQQASAAMTQAQAYANYYNLMTKQMQNPQTAAKTTTTAPQTPPSTTAKTTNTSIVGGPNNAAVPGITPTKVGL